MMHAEPQPETAVEIKAALHAQEVTRRALLECEETPEQLVAAAGDYLDATDALYRAQINVPRVVS